MNVDFLWSLQSGLDPEAWLANGCNYPRIKIRAQNHEHGAVHSDCGLATDPDRVIGADAGLEFFFSSTFSFFLSFFKELFICFRLCSIFIATCGISLVVASGGYSGCHAQASHCGGFSCCGAQALEYRLSIIVAHGPSSSSACGIFLDQGLNLCPLQWQVDS